MVAVLVVWAVRRYSRGDAARTAAVVSGVLIVNEALIGAALVLFGWVGEDQSFGRVASITLHLTNTFLLLAALTLTAWFSSGRPPLHRPLDRTIRRMVVVGAAALVVVGAAGAVTALGDTLFPPDSIAAGLRDDFTGVFLVRLRWIHPALAVATAGYLLWLLRRIPGSERAQTLLRTLIVAQVGAGVVNIALLAPVWMQLVHLLLADAVWIAFVVVGVSALSARSRAPVSS